MHNLPIIEVVRSSTDRTKYLSLEGVGTLEDYENAGFRPVVVEHLLGGVYQ